MRALGIDLGSKRIGVATSDRSGTIATPLVVIQRGGSHRIDYQVIADLAIEHEAECVVVGLPFNMSGAIGPAAQLAIDEANEMANVVAVPVYTYDERLTTVTADNILMEQKMKAQARRRVVDKVAAAVMLQSWLDRRRHQLMDEVDESGE